MESGYSSGVVESVTNPANSVYRAALATIGVIVPVMAAVFMIGTPDTIDPTEQRLLIGGLSWALFLFSWRPWGERHLERITQVFMLAVGAWIAYWAAESGFEGPDLGSLIVYQFGLIVVFPLLRHLVLNMAVWLVYIGLAYTFVAPSSQVHPIFLLAMPLVLSFAGAVAVGERERLLGRLRRHRTQLEVRVAERTEELRQEVEHRRRAEAKAQAANEAKSQFLTRMSHEVRTPINVIIGYSEMLHEDATPEMAEDLSKVLEASQQLLRMVDDMLDVRRIETGQLRLAPEVVEAEDLVEDALTQTRSKLAAAGCTVQTAGEAVALVADRHRVVQVLVNLLDNAARFAPGAEVTVRVQADAEAVAFEVADTGAGIPEGVVDHVFEPFAQADESFVREVDGAGLGLAVSRELAERMGGTLEARNEGGAVFRLGLPLKGPTAA